MRPGKKRRIYNPFRRVAARKFLKFLVLTNVTEKSNQLIVITKAKELCSYVMTVTQKSPKHFRFTFVTRMQNLSLDVIENA